jgi:hypothetical protein
MREANDLDYAVRAHATNDDVSGTADALFLGNETASNAERVHPHTRGCRYLLRACSIGHGSQSREYGPNQQVVTFCRVDAESSCTLE